MEFRKEEDSLSAAIDYCLRGNGEGAPLSWASVVKALQSSHVGETGLAKRIKNKYCQNEGGDVLKLLSWWQLLVTKIILLLIDSSDQESVASKTIISSNTSGS